MAPPAGRGRKLKKIVTVTLQEMRLARAHASGKVNVEVDSTESVDLTQVLEEMRTQYEAVVMKNKLELEKWFKAKVRWENLRRT